MKANLNNLRDVSARPARIAVASTFTAEPLAESLSFWTGKLSLPFTIEFATINQVFQQLLDPSSQLSTNQSGVNVVLVKLDDWLELDASENLEPMVRDFSRALRSAAERSVTPHLVFLCPVLNPDLKEMCDEMAEVIVNDLADVNSVQVVTTAELAALYPVAKYADPIRYKLGRVPYTPEFFAVLGTMIARRIHAWRHPRYKVIVLDCDQTIWNGVCGEAGPLGIEIDPYRNFLQQFVVARHAAGMLICLCSKNNEQDVIEVFECRSEMPLKREHIVSWRINWRPKSENLRSLAVELQLGLDSFIFIDDDPIACAEVRANCPEVLVLQLPQESSQLPQFFNHVWAFDRLKSTAEDQKRTILYRQNLEREQFRTKSLSLADFLRSLDLRVRISQLEPHHLPRVSQLTQRTNQFNFTTIRRSENEVQSFSQSDQSECLVVDVGDRFGDYGLVGVMMFCTEPAAIVIDTFLLSCRSMGRGIEHRMLAQLGKVAQAKGLDFVEARFISSAKNQPALDFLETIGAPFQEPFEGGWRFKFPAEFAANLSYDPDATESMAARGIADNKRASNPLAAQSEQAADANSFLMTQIATELCTAKQILGIIDSRGRRNRPDLAALIAPRNPLEKIVVELWSEVLRLDRVSVEDNLFELGGDSLLATMLLSRVRDVFQVELSLQDIFDLPTVAGLAGLIEREQIKQIHEDKSMVISRRVDSDPAPLSFAQQRLWFFNRLQPGNAFYNEPLAIRMKGTLEPKALEEALNAVVARHESLRTVFPNQGDQPVQAVLPALKLDLPLIDLSLFASETREDEASRLLRAAAVRPFDLENGPLIRTTLIRLGEMDHVLSLTTHHIISDGWSMAILLRELSVVYESSVAGTRPHLPELQIQYADYAAWQRRRLDGEALEKKLSYWRKQLQGAPALLELPADRPRPAVQGFRGSRHCTTLSESLAEHVRALSHQEGVTHFMTLLAAFVALLAHCTNREDIVVGTDLANRTQSETEGLIGFFVNLLPLRVDLSGNPTFRELLRRVREVALGAYAHQEVPFEKLVEELQPERSLSHNPLVQVLFVFQNTPVQELSIPKLSIEPLDVDTETSKFDLGVFVREIDGKLLITWVYNTDLFEAKRISGMARHYQTLLANLLAQPIRRLSSIEMISKTDKAEQKTTKDEGQVSRLRNLMSARRQAVNLSRTRGVRTEYLPDKPLPLMFQPDMDDVDLADWAGSNRDFINKELLIHGALLFRGFDLASPAEFEKFAEAISPNLFAEYGDLPREGVGGKVYGSTPYPSDQAILFHNESSHMHRWPMRIWFFCVQAAEHGGETPVVDCRRVYQLLDPKLRDRFTEKKLMYVRNYIDGLDVSWQTFFRTTDRSVVEDYCRRSSTDFEWNGDRLRTKQICPAVVKHPQTNEMVFFNQLQLHHVSCLEPAVRQSLLSIVEEEDLPRNVYYGDGSPIEDSVIEETREIYEQVAVSFPWQKGDVVMLNNMLVAHGRNPYTGARKIVVAMGEMVSQDELK